MTVHSNGPAVCVVMNAVSNHPKTSPIRQAPHQNQPDLTASAQPSLSASVASAVAAAAAAAAAATVGAEPAFTAAHSASPNFAAKGNMAVTSTVPPGARSTSPNSAAGAPYGCSGMTSSALLAGGTPSGCTVNAAAPVLSPGTPSGHAGATPANRCCDSGRTIYTDPVSGQTLCSCQYDMLSYQRLAAAGGLVAGPGGVPIGVYPEGMSAYLSGISADQPPFYTSPPGLDLKDNLVAGGAPWPYPSVYHPYDAAFAGYPFSSYGIELNNSRRKNATRETTSTLKAWLNEHKKNPYPTKGEKIMLAIITKMTLTQVSTWFANARRRLKKENKMTWEPRNRVDDDDANIDDDDHKSTDDNDMLDAKDNGLGSNEDKDRPGRIGDMLSDRPGEGNNSEWSGSRPGSPNDSPDIFDRPGGMPGGNNPMFHPATLHHHFRPSAHSPPDIAAYQQHQQQLMQHHPQVQPQSITVSAGNTSASLSVKPRIWSLADMAKEGKENPQKETPHGHELPPSHSSFYCHPGQHPLPGKILSPLAARMPNYSPYIRPDIYRGFYGGSAGVHLAGATQEFLEHQRTFGANITASSSLGMNPLLWKAAVSGATGAPFAPLSLTTNNQHQQVAPPSGASPSASSTSSSMGCDVVQTTPTSEGHTLQHHHLGPISGNSTSSSASSNSGKLSPGINVTSLSGKP